MIERILFCPCCNSSDIHPFIGGMTGAYQCFSCGYIGPLVIQKDFIKSVGEGLKRDAITKPGLKKSGVKKPLSPAEVVKARVGKKRKGFQGKK